VNHPAYVLIKEIRPGDVVLHYDLRSRQIALWSRAASYPFAEDIVWGSHGVVARKAGVEPYRRSGWRVLLEGPFELAAPVTFAELRAGETAIRAAFGSVRTEHQGSLYLPLEISDKWPLRPTQFYLTKAPLAWLKALPGLAAVAVAAAEPGTSDITGPVLRSAIPDSGDVGQAYIPADEQAATSEREPFSIDPSLVDRGLRGHARTQNALARLVGGAARAARADEPQFDLAWISDEVLYVAEVKSLTASNEERQLGLGLGQVLRYAHLLPATGREVRPVLAVERRPSDASWSGLCDHLGVRLVWQPFFDGLGNR
jgi:hypothetical protein